MESNKYLWIKKKNKYEKLFIIDTENVPYYIGNNDHDFLNFRQINNKNKDTNNKLIENKWIGKNKQFNIEINILNDIEKIKNLKSNKDFVVIYNSDYKIINDIQLCYAFLNDRQLTNNVSIISDEQTMNNIENIIKLNNERQKWYHKIKIC